MGTDAEDPLIRLPEVWHLSGLSGSAVYQKIKDGEFPAQVKSSVRSSAWVLSEIVARKNALIAARNSYLQKSHSDAIIHGFLQAAADLRNQGSSAEPQKTPHEIAQGPSVAAQLMRNKT